MQLVQRDWSPDIPNQKRRDSLEKGVERSNSETHESL